MSRLKFKYRLMPGYVTSKHDGDEHYIGENRLRILYGLKPDEVVSEHGEMATKDVVIRLYPRYDGDYKLPEERTND